MYVTLATCACVSPLHPTERTPMTHDDLRRKADDLYTIFEADYALYLKRHYGDGDSAAELEVAQRSHLVWQVANGEANDAIWANLTQVTQDRQWDSIVSRLI